MTSYLFVFILLAASAPPALGQTTFIRAGRLIDPEAGTASPNQVIAVEAGKVKAVGPNLDLPKGANVIDRAHAAVMPGLFDAHTHLCMTVNLKRDAGNYFLTTIRDPDTYRAVQGVANARDMHAAGFTTVRDVGDEGDDAQARQLRHEERRRHQARDGSPTVREGVCLCFNFPARTDALTHSRFSAS